MFLEFLQTYGVVAGIGSALVLAAGLNRRRQRTEAERAERAEFNLRSRDHRA